MVSNNKTIQVKENCKIYIMSPANVATGGPEALHQLAFTLKNSLKLNTFIYYVPQTKQNPIHDNYKMYSINFVKEVEDDPNNILIVPEYFEFLQIAKKFNKIQKAIWWLSIDNYFGYRFRKKNSKLIRSIIKIPFNFINFFNLLTFNFFGLITIQDYLKFIYKSSNLFKQRELSQGNIHLAQSKYAFNFLSKKIINLDILSDYIRDDFFDSIKFDKEKKENIITYNPLKSNQYMKKIINNNKKITFIPLVGLKKDEIINILKKSKIYFDIGSHPGKDRIPREAALLGNCIITNKRGSASNIEDINIPNDFKFNENFFNIKKITKKINYVFNNYEAESKKFDPYINKITLEKKVFENEVKKIFGKKNGN